MNKIIAIVLLSILSSSVYACTGPRVIQLDELQTRKKSSNEIKQKDKPQIAPTDNKNQDLIESQIETYLLQPIKDVPPSSNAPIRQDFGQ